MIRFGDLTLDARAGHDLLGLLLDAEAPIEYLCMSGTCRTCRVRIISGGEHLAPMNDAERWSLKAGLSDVRLACQAVVTGTGDIVVDSQQPTL